MLSLSKYRRVGFKNQSAKQSNKFNDTIYNSRAVCFTKEEKEVNNMEEMIDKIIEEVQQNLEIPGYSDKNIRDIVAMVLTIAFAILNEKAVAVCKK